MLTPTPVATSSIVSRRDDVRHVQWYGEAFDVKDLFVTKVRMALAETGIDQRLYAGHSFGIGAAIAAAAVGIPAHTINMLSQWSSGAYALYIRVSPNHLWHQCPADELIVCKFNDGNIRTLIVVISIV